MNSHSQDARKEVMTKLTSEVKAKFTSWNRNPNHTHCPLVEQAEQKNHHELMHLLQQDALVSCPGCLYAIRFQAMEAKLTDLIQKGRWQRLYLKHCFSPETQYLFMILYELLGIDREADVKDLIKTSLLPETGPLAQMTPTPGSKRYYLSYCEDWFLRRYNKKEAKWCLQKRLKLVPANRLDRWLDGIKLSFPRIIASIIIGYLPLIFTTETWYVSIAEAWGVNFLLPILTLSASMFYLFTEVKNNLEYTTEVYRDRARSIFWFSLRVSLYLGMLLLPLIGVYLPAEAKIDELSGGYPYLWIFFSYANFCLFLKMLLFHVPLALFIGIIVQVIWEEKPVSYPL